MNNVSPKHIVTFMCEKPNLDLMGLVYEGLQKGLYTSFGQAFREELRKWYGIEDRTNSVTEEAVRLVSSFYLSQYRVWYYHKHCRVPDHWISVGFFIDACIEAGSKQ